MFNYLYYKLRFGSYLKNDHGIKKFAERSMGELIRKVTKKSAFYREMNENLMVEKANLRMRSDELQAEPMLDAGEFFSMRRRLWANAAVVAAFVVAAIFLNLLSIAALVQGGSVLVGTLRWFAAAVLALVLIGGGLVVTERLIESFISPRRDGAGREGPEISGTGVTFLWGLLLVGIELAIVGLADVQARLFVAGGGGALLYYGYIVLSMILPVVAGAVRWDAMRYIDVYKTTQANREMEGRLAQIESILRQNGEYESNFYKLNSISYWDSVNEFKTYKDNLNERSGVTERLKGHFAQSYDAFQAEAGKRYESDIRDITSKSMRKLETAEGPVGSKLGQDQRTGGNGRPALATPVPASAHSGDSDRDVRAADTYFEPKPIR